MGNFVNGTSAAPLGFNALLTAPISTAQKTTDRYARIAGENFHRLAEKFFTPCTGREAMTVLPTFSQSAWNPPPLPRTHRARNAPALHTPQTTSYNGGAMPTVLDSEGPLYLPTREEPATNQLFENALPCPECCAGQESLWPVQSAEQEGVCAVMCDCGHIGGNGSSVADAITTWNDEARAACHPLRKG